MEDWEGLWTALREPLARMRDLCALAKVPFLVVVHPVPHQGEGSERYQSRLLPILQELGVESLDLRGNFEARDWIPFDGHYSKSGHRKVALQLTPRCQSLSCRE